MTTYSQLRQVIPDDQALANKALQASLEQVKAIFNTTVPAITGPVETMETNYGLNLINALTKPIPDNVEAYFTQNFSNGTGPDGLLLLTDVIGTPTGWVHNAALSNTIEILNSLTSAGALDSLTNSTDGV